MTAKEAVREACVAFSDIIDDLRQEEAENNDSGNSNLRSEIIQRSYGRQLEELKGRLNFILEGLHQ